MKSNNLTADQLRKSILQLAIQGKLVKQDPNDEPASELVKKIYAEKNKLIKEGKIKKEKQESFIYKGDDNCYYEKIGNETKNINDELPFDIPDSWTWIRLSSFSNIYTGNSINENDKAKKYTNVKNGVDYIGTKDITFDRTITYNNGIRITDVKSFKIATEKSLLMCIEGGSAGRKIAKLNRKVCFGNKLACFDTYYQYNDYLLMYLESPFFINIFKEKKSGIISGVSLNALKSLVVPFPPLNEQVRMVHKFLNMEPYFLQYNVVENKLTKHETEFPEKLKKSILQYAIEGKLVKQDPNDEPASVLLERIKVEKEKLIKEGKIKREKNESCIYQGDDKNYYEKLINFKPLNWSICKMKDVLTVARGGSPRPIENYITSDTDGINWIKISDATGNGKYIFKTKQKIRNDGILKSRSVKKDDFLLTNSMSFGHPYILKTSGCIHDGWLVLSTKNNVLFQLFLYYLLMSPLMYRQLCGKASGGVVKNLNINKVEDSFLYLPPYNEQIKISDKIEKILKLFYYID